MGAGNSLWVYGEAIMHPSWHSPWRALAVPASVAAVLGAAACDGLFGVDATFVDASTVDGGKLDAHVADAGSGRMDATTPRDSGHDSFVADSRSHDVATSDVIDAGPCSPDLQTDPDNCGRCGHACVVGACVSGQCQPVQLVLAFGTGETPNFLTVADGFVFWTEGQPSQIADNGGIYFTSVNGGLPMALVPSTPTDLQHSGWGVQVANGRVYFVSIDQGVYSCPTNDGAPGCDAGPLELVSTGYNVPSGPIGQFISGISAHGDVLYVTSNGGGGNATAACKLGDAGGSNPCSVVFTTSPGTQAPVGYDGGVVWGNNGNQSHPFAGGAILECPATGGCSTGTIDMNVESPQYLAIDDDHIYWTELTGYDDAGVPVGRVMACPRALNCQINAHPLANMNAPSIAACRTDIDAGCGRDGGPMMLATGDAAGPMPFQIALDDAGVYWTNFVPGGAIVRVAKP